MHDRFFWQNIFSKTASFFETYSENNMWWTPFIAEFQSAIYQNKTILNIFLRIFQNFIISYFSFSSWFVLKKWLKQFTILQNSDKSFSICWPLSVLPLSMLIIIITNVKLKFFCKICNARTKISSFPKMVFRME